MQKVIGKVTRAEGSTRDECLAVYSFPTVPLLYPWHYCCRLKTPPSFLNGAMQAGIISFVMDLHALDAGDAARHAGMITSESLVLSHWLAFYCRFRLAGPRQCTDEKNGNSAWR